MEPERQNPGHAKYSHNMLLLMKCAASAQWHSKPNQMYVSAFLENTGNRLSRSQSVWSHQGAACRISHHRLNAGRYVNAPLSPRLNEERLELMFFFFVLLEKIWRTDFSGGAKPLEMCGFMNYSCEWYLKARKATQLTNGTEFKFQFCSLCVVGLSW